MFRFSKIIAGGLIGSLVFSSTALADIAPPFPDVASGHKNALAIKILRDRGVVSGDGRTGLFMPDRILNRAEYAKMIVEALGWTLDEVDTAGAREVFPDLPTDQWYTKYILKAHEKGVIQGTGAGLAEPGRQVLLVEAVAMTFRAYGVSVRLPYENEKWYDPYMAMAREEYLIEDATVFTAFNGGLPRAEAAQIISNGIVRFGGSIVPGILYPMMLTSPAFTEGEKIPVKYTCDGEDVSPRLNILTYAPATESYALTVTDPDAPSGTVAHFLIWNIPGDITSINENEAPEGAIIGANIFGRRQYNGPCPPEGETHRYIFKLYALNEMFGTELNPLSGFSGLADLEQAILLSGAVIGEATLTGLYGTE